MDNPAPGGSASPEERKGLSKFVRRASKVFRRRSSARASTSGPSDPTQAPAGAAAGETSAAPLASPEPIEETAIENESTKPLPATTPEPQAAKPKTTELGSLRFATTAAGSSAILEERARALFAKYGLTLEPGEWTSPIKPDAERVEKKIRMRIHRACHHCQTTFGADRVCNNCKHSRCKKCPRYPIKRAKEPKSKAAGPGGAHPAVASTALDLRSLTMSSRATGKQVSYRPAKQRVRRKCHQCETPFEGRALECSNCGHARCQACPREPPKKEKYPAGYPGDSDYSAAKREKPKLEPDAVKSVEERMKKMEIASHPQASPT